MTDENFKFEIGDEVTVNASADELSSIWVPAEANGKCGVIFQRDTDIECRNRYYIHSPDKCLNNYYVLEYMLVLTSRSKINTDKHNFNILFN